MPTSDLNLDRPQLDQPQLDQPQLDQPEPSPRRRGWARSRVSAVVLATLVALGVTMVAGSTPASAIEVVSTPTSITWTTIEFKPKSNLTGRATLTINSNGSWNFTTRAHQSRVLIRDYSFACVVVSKSGAAYSFEHHGTVGPRRGGGRTENWTGSGTNRAMRADFANIRSGWRIDCRMSGGWDGGGMIKEMIKPEYVAVYVAVVGAAAAA